MSHNRPADDDAPEGSAPAEPEASWQEGEHDQLPEAKPHEVHTSSRKHSALRYLEERRERERLRRELEDFDGTVVGDPLELD